MSFPLPSPSTSRLLPGDSLNFSFSPSSPPASHSYLSNAPTHTFLPSGTQPTTPSIASTMANTSSISPSLFSPDSAASNASLAHSISSNLGPDTWRALSPMEEDQNVLAGAGEEDSLRRGPPAADTPGGDCKSLCLRHQRMANGGTNLMLQKSIENLPPPEQTAVNTIWSLFSSAPSKRRLLILRGLLTIACPSQLTFLQDHLTLEMRLDPIELLPREIALKVFGYLDAISLGRAAQVSKLWKGVADDDLLWRTMCEQHIERKCEKCGWGLPLLGERRRRARGAINGLPNRPMTPSHAAEHAAAAAGEEIEISSRPASPSAVNSTRTFINSELSEISSSSAHRASKRAKTRSPTRSHSRTNSLVPSTRPWKYVYCERLAIERNWRRGICVGTVLSGHTDAVTCLQVAEDLPHPNFPILMTGSWDRSVRIWNLETGNQVGVLRGHTRGVRALQFDALKLVTGSMDATLKIWNWRTGECMRTLRGHRDAVICLTYDKQLLVSGSGDSTIRVWDFGTGEVQTLRGHTEWVNSVALWDSNADCDMTSSSTSNTTNQNEGDLGAPTSNPEQAKLSSKGKFLFSGSDDMTIRVWDLFTRQCVRVLHGHVAQVQSIKIIVSDQLRVKFPTSALTRRATNDQNLHNAETAEADAANFLHVTGNGTNSTTSCESNRTNNQMNLDSTTAATGNRFPAPDSTRLIPLDILGDKRPEIVSAGLDNTIKVWDVERAECKRTMFGHIEGVWDVDVDKLRIVSGSHDRTLKIWDRDTGKCLHTLVGHTSAVTAVVLQDQYCVTGGDDSNIRIWNFGPRNVSNNND